MSSEPIYAVTYAETVTYDDGYGHGSTATSKFNVFKEFESFKDFEDWVISNQHRHLPFKAYLVEPLEVTPRVTVEVKRK